MQRVVLAHAQQNEQASARSGPLSLSYSPRCLELLHQRRPRHLMIPQLNSTVPVILYWGHTYRSHTVIKLQKTAYYRLVALALLLNVNSLPLYFHAATAPLQVKDTITSCKTWPRWVDMGHVGVNDWSVIPVHIHIHVQCTCVVVCTCTSVVSWWEYNVLGCDSLIW